MRPFVVHWLERFLRPDVAELIAPTWFMCIGIAGLVGLVLMLALARRRGLATGTIASVVLWGYLAGVLAGIVVPMTIDAFERLISTGHLDLRWAGMTSFWGYLACAVAVAIVCKRDRIPLARVADLAAIPIGFVLVFARLGCFMAGCDYGKVSALPWAVRFPAGSPAWRDQLHAGLISAGRGESLAVQPTQLYEALLGLVIVVTAWIAARRVREAGRVFLAAAATYAIGRLVIETLRGDIGRGIHAGLSSGQIFSLLVLIAIFARLVMSKRVMTVAATVLLVGTAHAQPADPLAPIDPLLPVVDPVTSDDPPPLAEITLPPPAEVVPPLRPIFAFGLLFGGSTAVNRPGEQVPDLSGATLSFGYVPGRFGLWLDLDRFTNNDAAHDTAIASVSFAPRITPHLWIGVRAGIGVTHVNFMNSAFQDVTASDVRIDAMCEYVMNHNWALWIRPLTIDVVSSAELGGPITTLQFRAGVAYRFGERSGRPRAAPSSGAP